MSQPRVIMIPALQKANNILLIQRNANSNGHA